MSSRLINILMVVAMFVVIFSTSTAQLQSNASFTDAKSVHTVITIQYVEVAPSSAVPTPDASNPDPVPVPIPTAPSHEQPTISDPPAQPDPVVIQPTTPDPVVVSPAPPAPDETTPPEPPAADPQPSPQVSESPTPIDPEGSSNEEVSP